MSLRPAALRVSSIVLLWPALSVIVAVAINHGALVLLRFPRDHPDDLVSGQLLDAAGATVTGWRPVVAVLWQVTVTETELICLPASAEPSSPARQAARLSPSEALRTFESQPPHCYWSSSDASLALVSASGSGV